LDDDECEATSGAFEFSHQNQSSSTQVLASADETSEKNTIPEDKSKEIESLQQQHDNMDTLESQEMNSSVPRREIKKIDEYKNSSKDVIHQDSKEDTTFETAEAEFLSVDTVVLKQNQVVTDTMFSQDDQIIARTNLDENTTQIFSAQVDAVTIWGQLQSETDHLSRRLCEKLRLVLEPLVASKLQGDYRSGKRLNMKRIIGYIASGYRKDKVWLRRTKPAKRDYRVLLAVDDSESMKRTGAGQMALRAMAMLSNGMTQLDVGQLGIASFGEEMKVLHPFRSPFTPESGAFIVGNFKFQDKRTRTALCVESAMAAMAEDSSSSSPQLLILISDGRIERDSRSKLRSILREMSEQNILVVMLIVEGFDEKGRDSIIDMKEVSFEGGRPKVNFFMDNYPFPYYIIVEDMTSLPDILGDALRQWFEILSQTQS
jgi:midasin